MMLSHLCQARLWTRPERKAVTDTITNDNPSHRLKTWPALNNAIGGICHTEVLNTKETKTEYFLYSKGNTSSSPSSVTFPLQASHWNLKENNGNAKENEQTYSINCSYSQVSENPAYGLTPAWTNNTKSSCDSSFEMGNVDDENEYNNYEGITESETSSDIKEAVELRNEITSELHHNYTINANKIEHIKHYLQSSLNHSNYKSKNNEKVDFSTEDHSQDHSLNENLEKIRHPNSLVVNECSTLRKWKEYECAENSNAMSHVNILNTCPSSDNIKTCQESTSHSVEKRQKSPLHKLECGSTLLSQTNRTQHKVYEVPFHSNNLVTEQASEQMSLWTESYLPSNSQNHRHYTGFSNDWYQLESPKYQKLPLQNNSTPSPIPSQKISLDISDILQKSTKKSPANISMVVMQCTYLHSYPKENSSVKGNALPMGSLVAALYKESEWLYVQTPHGDKGFVNFANCMALGTLTDEYFALTNRHDDLGSAQDTESSDEESEPEHLVSMEPLQETNYSKLAEIKANYVNAIQQTDMEKILSMITKHGINQPSTLNDQNCDRKESHLLNSKMLQFTNEIKSLTCDNMQATNSQRQKDNLLSISNDCCANNEPCDKKYENDIRLNDLYADTAELATIPEKIVHEHLKGDLFQIKTYPNFVNGKDTHFTERKAENLSQLNRFKGANNMLDNCFSITKNCKDMDDSYLLSACVNQDKAINDKLSVSSIFSQVNLKYTSSDENKISLDDKADNANICKLDVDKKKNLEILPNKHDNSETSNSTIIDSTLNENSTEEIEKRKNEVDPKCFLNKSYNCLQKDDIDNSTSDSRCVSTTSEEETILNNCKNDNSDSSKIVSSILVIIENYSGKEEGTLSVKKGDLVTLLNLVNSEWMWVSSANGIEGYIPSVCTSQVGIF